jgi:S-DNA-T family DNA segregation ATPase FtsK/SpoIIIE
MARAGSASRIALTDLRGAEESRLRWFFRRNLMSLTGLGVLAALGAAGVALATWHVTDPSFSNAVTAPVKNVLGYPGAVIADLVMQFLGVAAPLLLLPPAFWGWRLLVATPSRFHISSAVTWLVACLFGAAAVATLPVPESWPLPTGLGGAIGDLMLRIPETFLGESTGSTALITGIAFALLALGFVTHAIGLAPWSATARDDAEEARARSAAAVRRQRKPRAPAPIDDDFGFDEETPDDRSGFISILLGAIAHMFYRIRSIFSRIRVRRGDGLEDDYPAGERRRHLAPSLLPDDFDDEEDEDEEDEDEEDEEDLDDEDDEVDVAPRRKRVKRKPRADEFELPPIELLTNPRPTRQSQIVTDEVLEENARLLESVLDDFGIRGEIVNIWPGPVVTLYELEPAPGIKTSRVISLADDIARSMSAIACRVAVIPGKNAIGIELPNEHRETVLLRELIATDEFEDTKVPLPLCLGKNIGGEPVIADLSRMPHLLVAGTTGSGKSVSINTMILSLVYRLSPEQCRLILIDPKMLELSVYDGIPHLLTPVVTDPKKAVVALKWAVREMEDRYRKMSKLGVRNIDGLNARLAQAASRGQVLSRTVHTGFDPDTGEPVMEREQLDIEPMPYIVVIIDEMADLMMVAGKEIEGAVQRLAQMARAAGIHVVMATQRPSVDVITGTIKANFPTRISFQVTSKIDSRTILGEQGAEQLLGQGDMLYMMGGGRITRVHGPFVSDNEVQKVVKHLKKQGMPEYLEAITAEEEEDGTSGFADPNDESNDLYDRAVAIVVRDKKASTSYVQRRLSIGYNRAASIIERMEQEGVISPANHAGKREILVGADDDY